MRKYFFSLNYQPISEQIRIFVSNTLAKVNEDNHLGNSLPVSWRIGGL
jgi:hypothetical protein